MKKREFNIGFYPYPLDIEVGNIKIESLPDIENTVKNVFENIETENDWAYAPRQKSKDIFTGLVTEKAYSARVFGLPKTHKITHEKSESDDHVKFHIWSISFFSGMRLTAAEAGFLDATPLKPGKLVDFISSKGGLIKSIEIAEQFWIENREIERQHIRFASAVHALFMAQYPKSLQFEQFIYLYSALDACYAIYKKDPLLGKDVTHGKRISWLCRKFEMNVPNWATFKEGSSEVGKLRSDAVHEALYEKAPFGFAPKKDEPKHAMMLEFHAVVCRLLVGLISGHSTEYVRSPTNTQQMHGLYL